MRHQKAKKAARIVLIVFLCLLLLINGYYIFEQIAFDNDLPKIFGYSQVVVISGSMEPTLEIGDLLIIHEQDSYNVDDIVTYRGDTKLVTHRIIAADGTLYTTKGDYNNVPDDDPIAITKIQGKIVLRIPWIGKVIFFLKSPFGMLVAILGLFAIIEIPALIKKWKSRKNRT